MSRPKFLNQNFMFRFTKPTSLFLGCIFKWIPNDLCRCFSNMIFLYKLLFFSASSPPSKKTAKQPSFWTWCERLRSWKWSILFKTPYFSVSPIVLCCIPSMVFMFLDQKLPWCLGSFEANRLLLMYFKGRKSAM